MFQIVGQPIKFVAHFTDGGVSYNPSAVTVTILRCLPDNGMVTTVILNGSTQSLGLGLYGYDFSDTSVPATYIAVFHSADAGIDKIDVESVWYVGLAWLKKIYEKASLIGAVAGETVEGPELLGDPLTVESAVSFEKTITIPGLVTADPFTSITLTVKRSLDDDDSDALLVVRLTLPGDVSDGVVWFKGRAVVAESELALSSSIEVVDTDPDTTFTIKLGALATDLPPSIENAAYVYEVNLWLDDKAQYAKGAFAVNQSVRREIASP